RDRNRTNALDDAPGAQDAAALLRVAHTDGRPVRRAEHGLRIPPASRDDGDERREGFGDRAFGSGLVLLARHRLLHEPPRNDGAAPATSRTAAMARRTPTSTGGRPLGNAPNDSECAETRRAADHGSRTVEPVVRRPSRSRCASATRSSG